MPHAAPKPCTYPGCNKLASKGSRCKDHAYNKQGGTSAPEIKRLYNSAMWKRARAIYLQNQIWCIHCLKRGRHTAATVVDHIKPHKGDPQLFFDLKNWQPLCKPCHDLPPNG